MKMSPNVPCPCGSGKKYKKCCRNTDDSPIKQHDNHIPSLRERNLCFIECIADALQLDKISSEPDIAKFKRAFTPKAVRKIHQSIIEIWPTHKDCIRVLSSQREMTTALYTGSYEPSDIYRAITRHSLYAEKILLVDPFMYPPCFQNEYNPLIHPEIHRVNAIKWASIWIRLSPCIIEDIVNFIHTPAELNPGELVEIYQVQQDKYKMHPELDEIARVQTDRIVDSMQPQDRGPREYTFLSIPEQQLLDTYRRIIGDPNISEDEVIAYIRRRKDEHPYYIDILPGQKQQLLQMTSGACYESAKRICAITNSHIITDYELRWKELELDHNYAAGQTKVWSPFAKALQNAEMKILNNVQIQDVVRLRQERRLEQMRAFFNKLWRNCRETEQYSETNSQNLAAELIHQIHEAKSEWYKINQSLISTVGTTAGALVALAAAGFAPAATMAVAVSGTTGLAYDQWQRLSFKNRVPAGFFLGLKGE